MIQFFSQEKFNQVKQQKKRVILYYLLIVLAYLCISGGLLYWYTSLTYKHPQIVLVKAIIYIITVIMAIFSFLYFGICYKRVNNYCKLCQNNVWGIKETSEAYFLENDDTIRSKDGVDMKSMIFIEWNKYKNNYFERRVLVIYDMDYPEIKQNSKVKLITQGNVLYSYEILEEGTDEIKYE